MCFEEEDEVEERLDNKKTKEMNEKKQKTSKKGGRRVDPRGDVSRKKCSLTQTGGPRKMEPNY